MRDRCIADEVIRQIPRENLLSLVDHCATGLRYLASPIFLPDLNLPAQIAVFAVHSVSVESDLDMKVLEQEQVVTVIATPLPPNMRIQVWCRTDWPEIAHRLGWEPSFTPCEVGADIMRYLLRMIEGNERANAWQPQTGKLTVEFSPLLQVIVLNWRISELKRWVEDYRSDNNSDIMMFHSEAKGSIDIYDSSVAVGMFCERPVNGAIELIPYIHKGATPAAVAKLQKWRDALQAAKLSTIPTIQGFQSTGKDDRNFNIPPDLPEELHDLYRTAWLRHEAARLSLAYEKAITGLKKDYVQPVKLKLPNRDSDKAKWAETWRLIQEWANKGMNARDIERRFSQLEDNSHLPGDEKTLRKIIEAGKAGLFDNLP